ncbi:hypothetical protein CVT26_011852 [Gymnopilus dilepis]|uniref:Uncharacterized protein n=1 Tax=Gymnopilus dilepis TaxID=231916 RepID=A0A409X8R9_9AGAR|nr:hypothetical protein CVT26_011852 [Gymnopilus dilepis]
MPPPSTISRHRAHEGGEDAGDKPKLRSQHVKLAMEQQQPTLNIKSRAYRPKNRFRWCRLSVLRQVRLSYYPNSPFATTSSSRLTDTSKPEHGTSPSRHLRVFKIAAAIQREEGAGGV